MYLEPPCKASAVRTEPEKSSNHLMKPSQTWAQTKPLRAKVEKSSIYATHQYDQCELKHGPLQ